MRKAALSLVPGLDVEVCGSYRRGKETCGDVDVLISHPDGRGHRGLFKPLLQKLTADGKINSVLANLDHNEEIILFLMSTHQQGLE